MEEIIVDVRTGEKRIRVFTPEEEARRLAEIEAAIEQEQQERIVGTKALLLDAVADLESAKTLQAEGILTAEDVAEVQQRVDTLKVELSS